MSSISPAYTVRTFVAIATATKVRRESICLQPHVFGKIVGDLLPPHASTLVLGAAAIERRISPGSDNRSSVAVTTTNDQIPADRAGAAPPPCAGGRLPHRFPWDVSTRMIFFPVRFLEISPPAQVSLGCFHKDDLFSSQISRNLVPRKAPFFQKFF